MNPKYQPQLLNDLFQVKLKAANSSIEALSLLFEFYHNCLSDMKQLYGTEYTVYPLNPESWDWVVSAIDLIQKDFPLKPHTVFQDNGEIVEIVADVWRETLLHQKESGACGLILMNFENNCTKLPFHIHPKSDRILFIIKGRGNAHYSLNPAENFHTEDIRSVSVSAGTLVYFPKDTIHTFSTWDEGLTTLTFHSPFIEFDDEISFEKFQHLYPSNNIKPMTP